VLTTAAATLASNPAPQLPGFLNVVGGQLNHYGYWAVLLLVMVEDFGIPVPGETILIAAAIFAGAGRLNVVAVGLVGLLAAILGDNIGFAIGHFGGRALALRWGKYIFLTEERLDRAEVFFNNHGGKIIVVARFIEGLRQANGIIAGISGMHWRRFVFFNAIGATLWVGAWVTIGYTAGSHINTIYHYITTYSLYVLIALVVLLAAFILRHVLRRRRRSAQRRARAPQESIEPQTDPEPQHVAEAPEASVVPDSDVAQEADVISDGAGLKDAAGPQEGAGPQDARGPQDGAEVQEGAEARESAGGQNGAEVQESGKRQSS
jgi:membrane protein DedA with SNARE-associated domain